MTFDDRLTSYDAPGTINDATYGYDSLAWKRVKKTVGGTLTKYLPDAAGTDLLSEYDTNDTLLRSYVTPSIDENISLYDGSNTYYYMRDGLGSVRALYNASEVLQNSYDYEAFGQAVSTTENVTQPYRFTGRAWDSHSSLHFYRTRYYEPGLGIFTQKDKLWESRTWSVHDIRRLLPLYPYVRNNPVARKDPTGEGLGGGGGQCLPGDVVCFCNTNPPVIPWDDPVFKPCMDSQMCNAAVAAWYDSYQNWCDDMAPICWTVNIASLHVWRLFCVERCMGVIPEADENSCNKKGGDWEWRADQCVYAGGVTYLLASYTDFCNSLPPPPND